ncbi:MAG: hypothetical protein LBH74_01080 [Nitrososphaerota archaeon]|jgi:hypothetical protein|uniref:hypothetical protein n=1 Tax=Candidatus Bathycorpusculum sp. TaxID=2994959 RepID=UPI002835E0D4|nr:hypothetical protein [Candidatus Termitimicrobium sp.]MCL2431090.1 hypothetical protein [Candidatus Termitimicrobium sp.]MDR0492225.1 hypothetical protein [Nitrososphaerota archaeon]
MNSLTLKENGFTDFLPLKGLQLSSLPENTNSIIIIADTSSMDKTSSDVLYIDKAKKLTKRIFGGYLAGYGDKTTRKIHTALFNEGYIEKTAISWMLTDNHKTAQKALLENFKKEHGDFPSWNTDRKIIAEPKKEVKSKKDTEPQIESQNKKNIKNKKSPKKVKPTAIVKKTIKKAT